MEGFEAPCKRVTKIDSFTIKQNVIEHHMGGQRSPIKTPSQVEFPNLVFYLPEADAQPFADHAMRRVVKGEIPGRLHGSLITRDHDGRVLFTLTYEGADVISVTPDRSDSSSEEIKLVKVEIYTEKMSFEYANVS